MKPCPKCHCHTQKLAYALRGAGETLALACRRCDYIGPETPVTYPPNRGDAARAVKLWDQLSSQFAMRSKSPNAEACDR